MYKFYSLIIMKANSLLSDITEIKLLILSFVWNFRLVQSEESGTLVSMKTRTKTISSLKSQIGCIRDIRDIGQHKCRIWIILELM